jgi:hypothetical protein
VATYFADTSFWIGLSSKRDQHDHRAVAWHQFVIRTRGAILTPEAVLLEWLNALSDVSTRRIAAESYPKLTVDAKGRVITGAALAAGDIPAHSHTAGDVTSALGYTPANRAGDHFTGPIDCGPRQTGLWVIIRQYAANGDERTAGDIQLWGACLQQGSDPQKAYTRTWASQTSPITSGLVVGPTVIATPDETISPLKIHGPGSNLGDSTLLELTADGELILAGGAGNGYRLADLGSANNPSGWAGVIKVKTPGGAALGYILLYSNP